MDKDLIIDVGQSEVSIALLENKRLIELNREKTEGRGYTVGDVYLGKVKKILPSLNAAFVDIGDSKDAFVHYLDLGLNFKAFDHFVNSTAVRGSTISWRRRARSRDSSRPASPSQCRSSRSPSPQRVRA